MLEISTLESSPYGSSNVYTALYFALTIPPTLISSTRQMSHKLKFTGYERNTGMSLLKMRFGNPYYLSFHLVEVACYSDPLVVRLAPRQSHDQIAENEN